MKKIIGKKEVNEQGKIFYSAEFYEDGLIYKNMDAYDNPEKYSLSELVYIAENGFPEDSDRKNVPIDDVVGYTRQQLIDLAGSTITADVLFDALSWQSPELLWHEFCRDSDENGHWIEAGQAYEKVYLPEFDKDIDRVGQAPVCYQEFFDNEWQDEDCRKEFLDELLKKELIHSGTVADAMKDFDEEAEM